MNLDELTHLIVFARVVDENSFSEAARVLGLAKSTVSKHVSTLEDRLGVRLLHRTSRHVSLTDAGSALYARCAELANQAQSGIDAVAKFQEAPRGVLRVHAPATFGRLYLSPLIAEFLDHYPAVELELLYLDRTVNIARERIDVSVQLMQPVDDSLIIRRLGTSRRFVCGTPQYLSIHGEPRVPEDLERHVCLVIMNDDVPVPWHLKGPLGEVIISPRGRVRANNSEALNELMLAGVGLGYPPSFAVMNQLRAGRLRVVLTDWIEETLPIFLAFLPGRSEDPKVRVFLDFMITRLGRDSQWNPAQQ